MAELVEAAVSSVGSFITARNVLNKINRTGVGKRTHSSIYIMSSLAVHPDSQAGHFLRESIESPKNDSWFDHVIWTATKCV